jgi:hypothetical protein
MPEPQQNNEQGNTRNSQCSQLAEILGRKTQKWLFKNISGRKNPRPNFWQIFQKKWRIVAEFLCSVLFT